MNSHRLDVYDIIILIDIHRDGKSIRNMADKLPIKKTAIGARIKRMEGEGLIKTVGEKRKAERKLTVEAHEWLKAQGYLRSDA